MVSLALAAVVGVLHGLSIEGASGPGGGATLPLLTTGAVPHQSSTRTNDGLWVAIASKASRSALRIGAARVEVLFTQSRAARSVASAPASASWKRMASAKALSQSVCSL